MKHLIIDTETTGLPTSEPLWDPSQPWPVELAALLVDDDLRVRSTLHVIVRVPVDIPAETTAIHGIDADTTRALGVPMRVALGALLRLMAVADVCVAHHAPFDRGILQSACHRAYMPWIDRPWRCTKVGAKSVLEEGQSARLADARRVLCGRETPQWHSALPDAEACLDVYAALLARGCWAQEGGAA